MSKRGRSMKENGGAVAGFSIMGAIAVATLVFVILNFVMIDENKKDLKHLKDVVAPSSAPAEAMRRMQSGRRRR